MKKIISTGIFLLVILGYVSPQLFSAEKDSMLALIDKEPWKQSWVQEDNGIWKLSLIFDKAVVFTFFKHKPSFEKGSFLGFSETNKPIRQEVIFTDDGSFITLKKSEYERFGDGSVCWAFIMEENFSRGKQKFTAITTTIIDDPGGHNEYRYSLWK